MTTIPRIVPCLETAIELVLGSRWKEQHDSQATRREDLQRLQALVYTSKVQVCMPPTLFNAVHLAVEVELGSPWRACEVVRELLKVACTDVRVDPIALIADANALVQESHDQGLRFDLYELSVLMYATAIQADALISRQPGLLKAAVKSNGIQYRGSISQVDVFLALLTEHHLGFSNS